MDLMDFNQYLTEGYVNLFSSGDKQQYKDDVFAILQASYAPIGGIHGSGFRSADDMVDNIPFWKLVRRSGKVVAVALYKDRQGRKRVAIGSDGTPAGKAGVASIFKEDFSRAFFEISGRSLSFHVKLLGYDFVKGYAIKPSDVERVIGEPVSAVAANDPEVVAHPPLKDLFYSREIGGSPHTKIMLGTPGRKIINIG